MKNIISHKKGFYIILLMIGHLAKNIPGIIEKHKQIIIIVVLGAVLASYLIPFDTLYQIATAQDVPPDDGERQPTAAEPPEDGRRPPPAEPPEDGRRTEGRDGRTPSSFIGETR
jgi:hypothetical protein